MAKTLAGAMTLAALTLGATTSAAEADTVRTFNCVGTRGAASCVAIRRDDVGHPNIRAVPAFVSEDDRVQSDARDKRWVERCQPTIRQDAFGVPRYIYAAHGCEFGRLD